MRPLVLQIEPRFSSFAKKTLENLIDFLRSHAPAVADEHYGQGHEQATGGTLLPAAWNEFVTSLGFGSEMHLS